MNAGREAGRLPMETVIALVRGDDYELPEGMAAEEAAAIARAFLAEAQKAVENAQTQVTELSGAIDELRDQSLRVWNDILGSAVWK